MSVEPTGGAASRSPRAIPIGVKVLAGLIVGAGLLGFFLLTQLTERPDRTAAATAEDMPVAGSPRAAQPGGADAALTPAEIPERIEGAEVGDDGVARWEPERQVDEGLEITAGLQDRVIAFVEETRQALPLVDGLTSLVGIDYVGSQIWLDHQIAVDLRTHPFEFWSMPLTPDVNAWECDGGICFDFQDNLRRRACSGAPGELLLAGASTTYTFRDSNDLFIGRTVFDASSCVAADQ